MVTPLGVTRHETWRGVLGGRCGAGPMSAMEQPLPAGRDGGQAPDLPGGEPGPAAGTPREVRYLRRALADALADAGFADGRPPYPPERCGLMIGTTLHGMRAGGQFLRSSDFEPLRNFLAASTLRAAARGLGLEGLAATTCSACSSSLGSVALAVTLLQSGQFDLVIAGGYDPISEYVYAGFNSLRLVAEGPLRPFTKGRQGMKLAEGYAAIVLERGSDARARGAKPLATVLGFGESADAHHLTQPHPQGDGAARAMSDALRAAGLSPADIDLVAAHATGTPDNDAAEFAAMSRVFGADLPRVPVVAFKSHLGHTLGGAGAVELILSAMALGEQVVPPCANVRREDVEFADLNLSTSAPRPMPLRATLNTSLGFGGANTCIVLGPPSAARERNSSFSPSLLYAGETRAEWATARERVGERGDARPGNVKDPSPHPLPGVPGRGTKTPAARRDVLITGVGVVLPGAIGNDAFVARLRDPGGPRGLAETAGPIPESDFITLLNARRVRRMSEYVKLSLAATALAFADAGVTDVPAFAETCAAVLGSTHGSANYSRDYYRQVVDEGFAAANPMLFAEGVPNAAAAHLSLMMSLKGACQTIIGSRTAGLDALRLAAERVAQGRWDRAVVSAGEEFSEVVNAGYRHCGLHAGLDGGDTGSGFVAGCGAVTLILESRESLERRGGGGGARPRGRVLGGASAAPGEGREVDAASRVLRDLGDVGAVLGSANRTWVDRVESAAVRLSARRRGRDVARSSLRAAFAETFSVTPLAGVAAVLLTGRLPMSDLPHAEGAGAEGVAVLCTDYAGTVSGVRVSPAGERG
jgi:3-oxoacyl-[acyl-carrier-protein] synthase II